MPKIWRILSIDGGGIRGLIPATVLSIIEKRTGQPIAKLFDIVAGTSTGAILSLGLTRPDQFGKPEYAAKSLRDLYERDAGQIFRSPASWWENLLRPKYVASTGLTKIMEDNFGDARLKNAVTDVLIPSYDIEHRTPHIFKSRWARQQRQYDFRMSDVARAASATPTMFEPVRLPRPGAGGYISLVDGGIFANNPSLLALSEAQSRSINKEDDFLVVSLGTGESMERMTRKYISDWGFIRWSIPMIELVSESISESVHEQMRHMLPTIDFQRYYRFQADLPDDNYYALDDPSRKNMDGLIAAGDTLLDDPLTNQEMNRLCEQLMELSTQHDDRQKLERAGRKDAATSTGDESSRKTSSSKSSKLSEATVSLDSSATNTSSHTTTVEQTPTPPANVSQFQFQIDRPRGYQVAICHADEDLVQVVQPLSEALNARGIKTIFEKFGLQPEKDIRRVLSQAAETSLINIVVLSPSLLSNKWAAKQLEWLYTRTLSGKNVILPVVHGFQRKDVPGLMNNLQWHKMPGTYLEYLLDLAEGTTADGIQPLAERVAEAVMQWFS